MATPNLTDYSTFVYTVMAVPTAALPTNSPWLPWSLSQAELFVGLCALWNIDRRFAVECGHADLAAQCSSGEADRHMAMQIVAIALEYIVFLEAYFNVQIAGGATIGAWLTVAGAADAHAVVDARGDFDFKGFLSFDLALAVAGEIGRAHV